MGWAGQKIVTITVVPGGMFDATSTARLTADAGIPSPPPPLRKGGIVESLQVSAGFYLFHFFHNISSYKLEFRLAYCREFDTEGVIRAHSLFRWGLEKKTRHHLSCRCIFGYKVSHIREYHTAQPRLTYNTGENR